MAITPEAFRALQALHDGSRYNVMHTTARELIDAGLAHAGFGILEITEAGRIWVRRGVVPAARSYIIDDANVANLEAGPQPDPKKDPFPPPSHPVEKIDTWHPPLELPPEMPAAPEVMPPALMADGTLAWSRDRAVRAAGAASGSTDHWPPPEWLMSFMDAYEAASP